MDWRNPDYAEIELRRMHALRRIREAPKEQVEALREHYRNNPADFIDDWGITFDPRNAERGLPTVIPFVLFPKQREFIAWAIEHWKGGTPGIVEKSRDMGISWLATCLACTLCIFYEGLAIGFGSRVVDLVDKIGTMKPLLPKARMFLEHLPIEFRGGWQSWKDAPYMRINFPATGSLIMGEGGDQIGRGDRASIYFVDEKAYCERQESIDQALSQTTNCQIDMSSVRGMNNHFAEKRHSGRVDVFIFDWRDDPRKDQEWYDKLGLGENEGGRGLDEITIAQEVDRDYTASVEGIVIPGAWARACLDACAKLGITPTGERMLVFDIADEGPDKNATCGTIGPQIECLDEWSGKGNDTFGSVQRVYATADEHGYRKLRYDSDGMGALVRGDSRIINDQRQERGLPPLAVEAFRGSAGVFNPEGEDVKGRKNADYFQNAKAQGWINLRLRAQRTYRWVVEGKACSPDQILSIPSRLPLAQRLVTELSQPTSITNGVGKIVINKTPDNMKSPNLADTVMMRYAPAARTMQISAEVLARAAQRGRRRR